MPRRSARDPRSGADRKADGARARRRRGGRRDHGGPRLTGPTHAARLAPLRPPTTWRLEGDDLIETTGKREHRWPLAGARRLILAPPGPDGRCGAWLAFRRRHVTLTSHSWEGPGRFEDRGGTYGVLVRAIAARMAEVAPSARVVQAGVGAQSAMTWTIALLGAGVAALLLFSLTAGAFGLGLSLAARLSFPLILIFAVTPWLAPPEPPLDPRRLPAALLP